MAEAVKEEEAAGGVDGDATRGDASIGEGLAYALVGALVLVPQVKLSVRGEDFAGATFFKRRKNPGGFAVCRNEKDERAFAATPAYTGQREHSLSRLQDCRSDALGNELLLEFGNHAKGCSMEGLCGVKKRGPVSVIYMQSSRRMPNSQIGRAHV